MDAPPCRRAARLAAAGSGGAGRFRGGHGVVRELEFLRPLTASILSERRAASPFGLLGGRPGARGLNLWLKRDGRVVSLGGKAMVQVRGLLRHAVLRCAVQCCAVLHDTYTGLLPRVHIPSLSTLT